VSSELDFELHWRDRKPDFTCMVLVLPYGLPDICQGAKPQGHRIVDDTSYRTWGTKSDLSNVFTAGTILYRHGELAGRRAIGYYSRLGSDTTNHLSSRPSIAERHKIGQGEGRTNATSINQHVRRIATPPILDITADTSARLPPKLGASDRLCRLEFPDTRVWPCETAFVRRYGRKNAGALAARRMRPIARPVSSKLSKPYQDKQQGSASTTSC
jgi:hypothetical protein